MVGIIRGKLSAFGCTHGALPTKSTGPATAITTDTVRVSVTTDAATATDSCYLLPRVVVDVMVELLLLVVL